MDHFSRRRFLIGSFAVAALTMLILSVFAHLAPWTIVVLFGVFAGVLRTALGACVAVLTSGAVICQRWAPQTAGLRSVRSTRSATAIRFQMTSPANNQEFYPSAAETRR